MNFLLDVYSSGAVDGVSTASSEPSNKNWDRRENDEFSNGFIAGFLVALAICIIIKLAAIGFRKIIKCVSTPNNSDEKKD